MSFEAALRAALNAQSYSFTESSTKSGTAYRFALGTVICHHNGTLITAIERDSLSLRTFGEFLDEVEAREAQADES